MSRYPRTKAKVRRMKRIITYVPTVKTVNGAGEIYAAFGAVVREQRGKLGITQAQLAERVDLSRTSVVNIETARQRVLLHDVLIFAKALKIRPRDFINKILSE